MSQDDKTVFKVKGEDLLKKVKEILKEGKATRIIIKDLSGQTYVEIPAALGIVGAAVAPVLAAVGALAALVANFSIEIVRKKDQKSEDASQE